VARVSVVHGTRRRRPAQLRATFQPRTRARVYIPFEMGYYLFNFTQAGADKTRSLRDQAMELLDVGLWGIGDKTPNRSLLAPGDHVLAYVGAPEKAFVGHGALSSGVHPWSEEEAQRHPEGSDSWGAGVSFSSAEVWDKPVPVQVVWAEMPASEKNPGARFFGGVVRIKEEDFQRVLRERGGDKSLPQHAVPSQKLEQLVHPNIGDSVADRLFRVTEALRDFLKRGGSLSEEGTRANFINRYLDALGYTGIDDLDHGHPVASGDFADYVLKVSGKRMLVVEAKRLGEGLNAKHAAQVVKYAAVLGLRWGIVTNGRILRLYDARVPDVEPEQRLVFEVDLAGYTDREDFDVTVFPNMALLLKTELPGNALALRAAQEAIRELLTTPTSSTLNALRNELDKRKLMRLTAADLTGLLSELLG
jgi:hypothetical protein